MEELAFIGILFAHLVVNIPIFIMLLIGFFSAFRCTIQKSSKVLLALGMSFLLLGLIPTILINYGYEEFINSYSFGYAIYLASLFSGDIIAILLLGISFIREHSLLVAKQKGRWIASIVMLFCAFASAMVAVFIPNWAVLFTLLFLRWILSITASIMLLMTIKSLRTKSTVNKATGRMQSMGQFLIQSQSIRADLSKLINSNADVKRDLGEAEPLLDKSVSQIKLLVLRHKEISQYLSSFLSAPNDHKIKDLKEKANGTENKLLKQEYNKAIEEHEKQQKSLKDLEDQSKIIELRITSAVSCLEKLKIDALHMKNVQNITESAALKELRQKTKDISEFIQDYKESFSELEKE